MKEGAEYAYVFSRQQYVYMARFPRVVVRIGGWNSGWEKSTVQIRLEVQKTRYGDKRLAVKQQLVWDTI
eukprot:2685906-Pyramimonas_sp.AAC.1